MDPQVVPGVFVAQGMRIRIPGLRISLSEDGKFTSDMDPVETKSDLTSIWLDAAVDHLFQSKTALRKLLALTEDEGDKVAKSMYSVMQNSMQSIVSCSTCMDAYQSSVFPLANIPTKTKQSWNKNRTPAYKRTAHIIGRAYRLPNKKVPEIRTVLKEHTKFRDWAVHPTSGFRQVVLNPETGRVSDWRFAAFNSRNAEIICRQSLQLLISCTELDKPSLSDEIREHSVNLREHLRPVMKKWRRRFGDLYNSAKDA